mmetsp:Transcript_7603/g.14302  ORF Transcript_7603/g.14302 Transcript_7603/m.14302 type:complete len:272 (-) Transcript_7603:775-1590(-)
MRLQRPSRCSWPVAARSSFPSRLKASPLTKPGTGSAATAVKDRCPPFTPEAFHSLTKPSQEPDATKSAPLTLLKEEIQGSSEWVEPTTGIGAIVASTVIAGFFFRWLQIARRPESSPVTKVSSLSMRVHSIELEELGPLNTSCLSSPHFHSRAEQSRPAVTATSRRSTSRPFTSFWCPYSVSKKPMSLAFHSLSVRSELALNRVCAPVTWLAAPPPPCWNATPVTASLWPRKERNSNARVPRPPVEVWLIPPPTDVPSRLTTSTACSALRS